MNDQPWILGISASHNGSACLLRGDEIVVAIQEERLSRFKRHRIYGAGPSRAVAYCLNYARIEPRDLSLVVLCIQGRVSDQKHDIHLDPFLNVLTHGIPTTTIPHHYGHAVSVFATSGFAESAILIVDGAGSPVSDFTPDELKVLNGNSVDSWETISLYHASGTNVMPLEKHAVEHGAWLVMHNGEMPSFGSLGGMFSAVAQQIFGEASEAGKVMGLAPYGEKQFPTSDFFAVEKGQFCYKDAVPVRFRHSERWPSRTSEYAALACSAQSALEDALIYLVQHVHELSGSENLCYAGGVALNSVANERIIRESAFKNVYIMPAAEDSGTAIGAAYYGLWQLTQHNSQRQILHDAPGRIYSPAELSAAIDGSSNVRVVHSTDVISDAVQLLCEGKIIGWFDGGSELGPRALGQRSILCDPRQPDAKETLNRRVKMREAFRPFAPAVLLEEAANWFEFGDTLRESPFMLRVVDVKPEKRERVPAIVHVDGTGRVQTLTLENNGRFYELVSKFYAKTGVPMVLNTSFNRMGEPIIETPVDAIACLLNTGLDCCVFEDRIVFKA
ncbi:MAG TPA: carbamoyltransferase C-terminal domain-containing protein [Pyrinomonadaceae bacterium]|jgi:carbamoyltransferase|nr:carbamoyltransferase C-terminal domain-containing protein [Pyrinomonadaceae bacterium]